MSHSISKTGFISSNIHISLAATKQILAKLLLDRYHQHQKQTRMVPVNVICKFQIVMKVKKGKNSELFFIFTYFENCRPFTSIH